MSYAIPSLTRMPAAEKGITIADFLVPVRVGERTSPRLRNVGLVIAGALLIFLTARISVVIPGNPVPFTMQNFGILVVGGALGLRRGGMAAFLYVALGVVGLPFFAEGTGGLAVIWGATGGYLVGFVVAAALVGRLAELGWDRRLGGALGATLLGTAVIYAIGVPVARRQHRDVRRARRSPPGSLPFLVFDIVKLLGGGRRVPGRLVGGRAPAQRPLIQHRRADVAAFVRGVAPVVVVEQAGMRSPLRSTRGARCRPSSRRPSPRARPAAPGGSQLREQRRRLGSRGPSSSANHSTPCQPPNFQPIASNRPSRSKPSAACSADRARVGRRDPGDREVRALEPQDRQHAPHRDPPEAPAARSRGPRRPCLDRPVVGRRARGGASRRRTRARRRPPPRPPTASARSSARSGRAISAPSGGTSSNEIDVSGHVRRVDRGAGGPSPVVARRTRGRASGAGTGVLSTGWGSARRQPRGQVQRRRGIERVEQRPRVDEPQRWSAR